MRKGIRSALVTVWVTVSVLFASVVGAVGLAATPAGATAPKLTTTETVSTKLRCTASAPVVGWVDADQSFDLTQTYPKYVKQGDTFHVITTSGDTVVPTEQSGITVINLSNLFTRTLYTGGFTLQSATAVPGTGSYKANATATPGPIPGGVTITVDGANKVILSMPGPFLPNGILVPPQIDNQLVATGSVGTKISSKLAGTIPADTHQSFPDYGFKTTARVNAPVVGATDAAASCAPNYGSLANGNGELTGTVPLMSSTTIIANDNPLVSIDAPADGAKYLPDAQIFADYSCTETIYQLTSCVATEPQGTQLDFSQFGIKTFTVTATDANGGVTEKTVQYSVGGNVTPDVDAGADRTVNGGALVTLQGSAVDPDSGQILSYEWTQVSGTPVVLDPRDADDPFEPNQRFTAPRSPGDLVFRLRVDDGFDTGEDTIVVHVSPNNGPVITNGVSQTINNVKTGANATMNGIATDPEGDTPITYHWTQVDNMGHPLVGGDPNLVTLTAPNSASTTFQAPKGPKTLYFQVEAKDSLNATAVGNVTVNVLANNLPVVTAGTNPSLNRNANTVVTLNGTATDADNNAPSANHVLSYHWTQVYALVDPIDEDDPLHVTLSDPNVAQPTFTAPAFGSTLKFRLDVTDGYDSVVSLFTVHVIGNSPPVADAGPDQTPGRGKVVTLDGSASSDPDLNAITYAWTQVDLNGDPLPGADPLHVTLSSSTAQKPTFTAPVITGPQQELYFKLVVADSFAAASPSDTVNIHLLENQAPVANAGPDQVNKATNSLVTLTGAASSDIDTAETLTYAWTQVDVNGDPVVPADPTKVTLSGGGAVVSPTFTSPHFATSTTLRFRLVVTDSFGALSAASFMTVQINANRAPAVGAPSVTPASRPRNTVVTVTVPASANDADGDPVAGFTYLWVQTDSAGNPCQPSCAGANVTLTPVVGTPRSATFVAPNFTVASETLFFRLTVNDGFGATAQSTNLTVTLTNTAPTVQWAIRGTGMAPTADTANATTSNRLYQGQLTELDGTQNPAKTLSTSDLDGTTTFTYLWTQMTTATGSTACTSTCMFGGSTATSTLAKPTFTMPATAANNGAGLQIFLRLVVTDQFGATTTPVSNIVLNRLANTAPTVTANGPAFVTIGTGGVQLTGTATDPQTSATPAQTLTLLWTQVDGSGNPLPVIDPSYVTLNNPTTLTPTFTAPNDPATLHFKLTASDGATTTSATANVEVVLASNGAPTANAGPDQTGIKAGQTVTLDGSASSDPESHTITYAWTQVDNLGVPVTSGPSKVTLSSATAQKPTFAAPANGPVTLYFRLVVTDKYGAVSAFDEVQIAVDANGTPSADAGPDQSGRKAAQTVTLDGSASSDPENNTITYAWTQVDDLGNPVTSGPSKVTLSSATAQKPTFAAPANGPVTLYFRLVVTDQFGAASTFDEVLIGVDANAAPVADAGPNRSAAPGQTVQLDGSASSDPEGHTFTYAWTQVDDLGNPIAPTVTLVTPTAQKPTFTAPSSALGTTLRFRLVVTDQFGAISTPSYVGASISSNNRPTANAGPDQTPGRGKIVTLNGSASSDPDNDTITYAWVQVNNVGAPVLVSDPLHVTLSSSTAVQPTFTAPVITGPQQELFFRLFVTDSLGSLSDPDTVNIHLVENNAPVANAGAAQTNKATNSVVTLTGAASSDIDTGETLTSAWVQVDPNTDLPLGPDPTLVTLSSSTATNPTFTAPHFTASTTLKFRLVVTDAAPFNAVSAPAFTTVQINANRGPTVGTPTVTPSSRPINTVVTVTIPAPANDADGDPAAGFTYQWVQTNSSGVPCAPSCAVANVTLTPVVGTPRSATFTAPAFSVTGAQLFFRLTAADGFGASTQSNNLTVGLTNTNPVLATNPVLTTGLNFGTTNPSALYVGQQVRLDARAATDADGFNADQLTYVFSGQPCGGLGEALGCILASDPGGYPGGSCRGVTFTPDPLIPGKASFTAPTFGPNNPTVCGLRVVVSDPTGGSVTRNWSFPLKANTGGPTAVISPVADKVLASAPGHPGVLALSAASSTDPDTNPAQVLGYTWQQVDPLTGDPVAADSPARGTFGNASAATTTWTAPSTAPYSVAFRVAVTDSITFPGIAQTAPVRVTTSRPGANAGPDRVSHPAQAVVLDGTASFDDAERPLTYSWKQLSGPAVTVQNALSSQATIDAPFIALGGATQTMTFELTTRNGLAASYDTVTVINSPWGQAVADPGAAQEVDSKAVVLLDGTASASPSGHALTYQWTQTGGTAVTLTNADTAQPSFTAPIVPNAGPQPTLTFQLVVNDSYGNSQAAFATVSVRPAPLPGAPTAVSAVAASAGATVKFTKGASPLTPITGVSATCTSSNAGIAKTVTGTASPLTLTGMTTGKTYTCTARNTSLVGTSLASAATPAFIVGAPAPAAVPPVASPGSTTATVTWTAPVNNGSAITGYKVTPIQGATVLPVRTFLTTATTQVITGLLNAKPYTFQVAAINARGTGQLSAASVAVIVGSPVAPAVPTASPGTTSIRVFWTAPANNGAGITGYKVTPQSGLTVFPTQVFVSTATSQVITGLTVGQTYAFRVAAFNARGTGPASALSVGVIAGSPAAPAPVTAAVPSGAFGRATVSWGLPADNGAPITGYKVTPYDGATALAVRSYPATPRSQILGGLTRGHTYSFKVQAVNARGTGPVSALSNAVTLP